VLVLNGPNLNLLGRREPALYGDATLADAQRLCEESAAELGVDVAFRQTNHEGELVDWLQQAGADQAAGQLLGVVLNAGAYSHTSIAIPDAIAGTGLRVLEVHVTNVHAREEFRQHSYISAVAAGIIVGCGVAGYPLAVRALVSLAGSRTTAS
jgi:3-dehydroquinate dehydratase II